MQSIVATGFGLPSARRMSSQMLLPTACAVILALIPSTSAQGTFNLDIVHWGDLHGRFTPHKGRGAALCQDTADPTCYGGLARLATSCKANKATNSATLCLDAGDAFSGSYWAEKDPDFSYLAAMNNFTDAYVLGNHDFDRGMEYLSAFIDAAKFPVLGACNMDVSKEPSLNGKVKKWATFKMNGANVALLGYTNVDESSKMSAVTKNIRFYDHTEKTFGMGACIQEFKSQNPGKWIVGILSSAGVKGDQALIKTLDASTVTFVVGGHDHDPFFPNKQGPCLGPPDATSTAAKFVCSQKGFEKSRYPYPLSVSSSSGQIQLMHAGWSGKYAGQLRLIYNSAGQFSGALGRINAMGNYYEETDGSVLTVPLDPQVNAQLEADRQALLASKNTPFGAIPFPLYVRSDIYIKEVPAGGVLCSALMWTARNYGFIGRTNSPVICLQNSATIRRDLTTGPNGEISIAGLENMLPPEEGHTMTIIEVPASQLKIALENSVSALNTGLGEVPDGRFLHIGGGLSMTYNLTGVPYEYNRTTEEMESTGSRVSGYAYECQAVSSETVRIVTNSQLSSGIDGYITLKNGTELYTYGPLLSEVVASYLKETSKLGNGATPNYLVALPPAINAPCNATQSWESVPKPVYEVQPLAAPAPIPPPGASPAPAKTTKTGQESGTGQAGINSTAAPAVESSAPRQDVWGFLATVATCAVAILAWA